MTYIYPQWHRAKYDLFERLKLNDEQRRTLSQWFESHVFEVGASSAISKDVKHKEQLEHIRVNQMIHQLSKVIIEKGLYMDRGIEDVNKFQVKYESSVLVFGSPLIVGPGTKR